tara:strand:- start:260 stop:1342 length:1083 start_codon:yes stop_codon:yes gene_type:complete
MDGYGGGFGGNLGGFQLPDFSGIDLEGIAAQVAKYTAEQDLANATNEYEKDAAETKLNQVKEYESGIAELPPIAQQVMEQLLPENGRGEPRERDIDIRDPIGTSSIVEPQVIDEIAQLEEYYDPYNDGYEDYIDEEPLDPIYEEPLDPIYEEPVYEEPVYVPPEPVYEEPVYVAPEPIDSLPEMPGIELPETPFPPVVSPELPPSVVLPEPPPPDPIYGREDPAAQTGSEAIFDRGYTQSNPAISNLIQQQRAAYGDALKRAVYKAPDRVQDDYVRPMSAAEFGSVPGRYTPPTGPRPYVDDPEFTTMKQDPALLPIAMNHGGALNLNSSSMNRGIGQLPPMQQNDKLTQLFAQSFNPRR